MKALRVRFIVAEATEAILGVIIFRKEWAGNCASQGITYAQSADLMWRFIKKILVN